MRIRRPLPSVLTCSCGSGKPRRAPGGKCDDCITVAEAVAEAAQREVLPTSATDLAMLARRARALREEGPLAGGRLRRMALTGAAGDELVQFLADVESAARREAVDPDDLRARDVQQHPELVKVVRKRVGRAL